MTHITPEWRRRFSLDGESKGDLVIPGQPFGSLRQGDFFQGIELPHKGRAPNDIRRLCRAVLATP
jgi:hypothetical protein